MTWRAERRDHRSPAGRRHHTDSSSAGRPNGAGPAVESLPTGRAHVQALYGALRALEAHADRIDAWGARAAAVLLGGGRLLAAGNGGSAAEAQHLTAELVGRYRDDFGVLQMAHAFEQATGVWKRRPPLVAQ